MQTDTNKTTPSLPDFIKEPGIYPIPANLAFSVGKEWVEISGNQRTGTIKEIHRIGFGGEAPVIVEVAGRRGPRLVRLAWSRFLGKWKPVEEPAPPKRRVLLVLDNCLSCPHHTSETSVRTGYRLYAAARIGCSLAHRAITTSSSAIRECDIPTWCPLPRSS